MFEIPDDIAAQLRLGSKNLDRMSGDINDTVRIVFGLINIFTLDDVGIIIKTQDLIWTIRGNKGERSIELLEVSTNAAILWNQSPWTNRDVGSRLVQSTHESLDHFVSQVLRECPIVVSGTRHYKALIRAAKKQF
ncbi:MAG: hypothetical protein AAB660_01580 [Patescibacteria group bacterium]